MTFKLPEPVELSSPQDERAVYGYTEAQLKQAIKDALEQAAQVCTADIYASGYQDACKDIAERIRKMIGEIK